MWGSNMGLLKRIKIAIKVAGGFGVMLVLMITVSAICVIALMDADSNFNEYRQIALQSNQASRVQANMLEARVSVLSFQMRPSPEALENAKQRL